LPGETAGDIFNQTMGTELSGLAQIAIASGALVACSNVDKPGANAHASNGAQDLAPPTIVAATLAGGVLSLHFSEPVAAPESVDPRKFRLTFGYYEAKADSKSDYYYASYYYGAARAARTWYTDVGRFFPDGTPLRQTAANTIQVPLPKDVNVKWVCDDVARLQKQGAGNKPGLYLHYADAAGPAIADRRGNRLRSIAPYWLTAKSSAVDGNFANKPIPVRLSCT
jgi:hypothetical protein